MWPGRTLLWLCSGGTAWPVCFMCGHCSATTLLVVAATIVAVVVVVWHGMRFNQSDFQCPQNCAKGHFGNLTTSRAAAAAAARSLVVGNEFGFTV